MSALTRSRLARLRPARRASDATLRRYTVVPSRAVRGYRSAVVDSATFQNGTLFPFLARVAEPAGARMRLWLHADDEQAVAPDDLGLSPRVQRRLNLEPSADLVLGLPGQALLTVRTPGATDLPTGAAVQVSPATSQALSTGNHVRRRALLTTGDRVVLPVKLMTRLISDDAVLVPMSLRTLGGFKPGTEVQLTAIPRRPLREQPGVGRSAARLVAAAPRFPCSSRRADPGADPRGSQHFAQHDHRAAPEAPAGPAGAAESAHRPGRGSGRCCGRVARGAGMAPRHRWAARGGIRTGAAAHAAPAARPLALGRHPTVVIRESAAGCATARSESCRRWCAAACS
jgi:hypothetical protein